VFIKSLHSVPHAFVDAFFLDDCIDFPVTANTENTFHCEVGEVHMGWIAVQLPATATHRVATATAMEKETETAHPQRRDRWK
jgi:hypothetical protein